MAGRPVEAAPASVSLDAVREEICRAAAGHKRAVVLLGDVTLPAPYPRVLPHLTRILSECEIRPSRTTFLCCPGHAGPTLGMYAIRRYGEETVGAFELHDWLAEDGKLDSAYEAADLRLAVLPAIPEARYALPKEKPHLCLLVDSGFGPRAECAGMRVLKAEDVLDSPKDAEPTGDAAVTLITGGGAPTDATMEGALASLRRWPADAGSGRSLVVAFDGREGLGSARFTLDLWALLPQAEEELRHTGRLPAVPPPQGREWDPAGAVAAALCCYRQVILFAPGLAEHEEGDALAERLGEVPAVAERLHWVANEADLWVLLEKAHGTEYAVRAEPLGWRSWGLSGWKA